MRFPVSMHRYDQTGKIYVVWYRAFTMMIALLISVGFVCAGISMAGEWPQFGKFYPDGHGGYVYFPLADTSFADKAESYQMGNPPPSAEYRFPPGEALGIPSYNESTDRGYITLGCGGRLSLQFVDNALVDVPGPDLYVFEIGDALEPTRLEISANGKDWMNVGEIAGGRADVDIAKWAKGGHSFRYVRLTDLKSDCGGTTPGADIDAVGAIGSGVRLTLSCKVLFDFGKHALKPEAAKALDALAEHFADSGKLNIEVAGHTDGVGSDAANQKLSEQRARSVADYLMRHFGIKPTNISVVGYGESQPVAGNDSEDGRQANRRVEIVIRHGGAGELWNFDEGPLAMAVGGDGKVMARYPNDNGRWFGKKHGRVISGYWVENGSSQTCKTKKDSSLHWGRMQITLNRTGNAFEGWWSYCDTTNHEGSLSGKRVR